MTTVTVDWDRDITFALEAGTVGKFNIDFSEDLGTDNIGSVAFANTNITASEITNASGVVSIKVSGGTVNQIGTATIKVTTSSSPQLTYVRSLRFYIYRV